MHSLGALVDWWGDSLQGMLRYEIDRVGDIQVELRLWIIRFRSNGDNVRGSNELK